MNTARSINYAKLSKKSHFWQGVAAVVGDGRPVDGYCLIYKFNANIE